MAINFQVHRHVQLFVERLLGIRNDLQVLADRIDFYVANEGTATEEQKASILDSLARGGQGVGGLIEKIQMLTRFVNTNLTAAQRTALNATADSLYGVPAADELRAIYAGVSAIRANLLALRNPLLELNQSYQGFRDDVVTLPAQIRAIPYVEMGTGPV